MIKLFKRKKEKITEEFSIGNYNFSFDYENSTVEIEGNKIIDLTIKANENIFDQLCENDDFEFAYGINPPEFYAREIDLSRKKQIIIDEKNQSEYEIALYFMEHNDVNINLSIHDKWILIVGWTNINGTKHPILIRMKK